MRAIGKRLTELGIVGDGQFSDVASAVGYESRVVSKQVLEVSRGVSRDSWLKTRNSSRSLRRYADEM
jgi:hypothetical protein